MLLQMITIYLVLVNAIGLFLMLSDKSRATRNAWRIPEATLMGVALAGGSVGAIAGMHLFRHKTRHPKFALGLPLILIVQIAVVLLLINRL